MHATRGGEAIRQMPSETILPVQARLAAGAALGRGWAAVTNLMEDLTILGQFAFGREYLPRLKGL